MKSCAFQCANFAFEEGEQFLPMLGPTLPGTEPGIEQARLIQECRPGLHRIATGASSGEGDVMVAGRQMHTVHHRVITKTASSNGASKAVLMDEVWRGTDDRFHHRHIDVLAFSRDALVQESPHDGDGGIACCDNLHLL